MIDIDREMVEMAAKHLPSLSNGAFEDPRVTLIFDDAGVALKRYVDEFDVAIIDCNDAVGTSEKLFEEAFYSTVATSLRQAGVCSVLAGSMLDEDFLLQTRGRIEAHVGQTTGLRLAMPSYHCGDFVFFMASSSGAPKRPTPEELKRVQAERSVETRYWSPEMHHASQAFPPSSGLA